MKNIKAVGIAFVLFLITITGIREYIVRDMPEYSISFGTWVADSKFASNKALKKMLDAKNTIPIFGSSELRHGKKSKFHAKSIFNQTDMSPIYIGDGGYQSLNHVVTLGSLGDSMKNRKLVLSVSPQWFKDVGVKKNAFGASYSEQNFIAFLKNENVSPEIKEYVINRIKELTDESPAMWKKVQNDIKWYLEDKANPWEQIQKRVHLGLTEYKSDMKLFLNAKHSGVFDEELPAKKTSKINWKKLYKKASEKGKAKTGHNKYGMVDKVYQKKYKQRIKEGDIYFPKLSIDSVEFDDLKCFLDLCKEQNIEVLVVMLPCNGLWYDYVNIQKDFRQSFYSKVKSIAEEYDAQYADMSGYEYKKYMFEDDSHLTLKGLVLFNEQIYKFYKQGKK